MKITRHSLTDIVYPVLCHVCQSLQTDGSYLCAECEEGFHRVGAGGQGYCVRCSEPFDGVFSEQPVCPNCSKLDYSFEFARSALTSTKDARELVHDFKYRKYRHLAGVLAGFCERAIAEDERLQEFIEGHEAETVVVPVPLHWRRGLSRGFNQAELISRRVAKKLGLQHLNLLKRTRYTVTQTRLTRHERLKNLRNAFRISKKHRNHAEIRQVILIDDVFTTGSTSEACAAILKKECVKVENVVVVTALRG